MKKVLFAFVLLFATAAAYAFDGDGAEILPFTSSGGVITGTVTVYPDGTAAIEGQCRGAAFTALGRATRNGDGSWDFAPILSDGDYLKKQGGWIPVKVHFKGSKEDANDGDDTDDDAGTIDVEPQGIGSGVGHGQIRLLD